MWRVIHVNGKKQSRLKGLKLVGRDPVCTVNWGD